MRISVDKRDSGHSFKLDMRRAKVYLDGQLFTRAVTADEEASLIIALKLGPDGKPLANTDGTPLQEILRGKVKIELHSDDGQSLRTPKVRVERGVEGLEVLVYSRIKIGRIRRMQIFKNQLPGLSTQKLRAMCEIMAGACAEHLCETAGDMFDPSAVAAAGREAFEEMLAREKQATQH